MNVVKGLIGVWIELQNFEVMVQFIITQNTCV